MKHTRQKGFTLIELVIYIGLLGILITILSQIFIATLNLQLETSSRSAIDIDGSYILQRLTYDIHRANTITSPTAGQSASTLVLDIVENGSHKTYRYTLSGTTLSLSDGQTTDALMGNQTKITAFTVSRVGNSATITGAKDTLQIALTVTSAYQLSQGPGSMQFQTTVGIR